MAVQTHNDTVMTANLTTLSEKNTEKEVTGVHLFSWVFGVQLTCQRASLGEKNKPKNPDLKGIVASYTLSFGGRTQGPSTWGHAAGDSYRLETSPTRF